MWRIVVVPACVCLTLHAQDAPPPATRVEAVERARLQKAQSLEPDTAGTFERWAKAFNERVLSRSLGVYAGAGLRVGGLVTGSGFALGPSYSRPDLFKENLKLRVSLVGSIRRFYQFDVLASFPRMAENRLNLDLYARHSDWRALDYFGPGANSDRNGRTTYRQEDTAFEFRAGYRPLGRRLMFGLTGGALKVNIGPGTDARFAPAEAVYAPQQAPAIDRQPSYFHGGPYAQIDFRDKPGDPHSGGIYVLRYQYWWDRRFSAYSFRQFDAWAERYIPFLNEKRVLAFRGKAVLTHASAGQQIPFFLQPELGGSDDLRGFRNYRFRDRNSAVWNMEYRWEVMPNFDMAVFVDTGKVFPRLEDFSAADLRTAGGVGFRFKNRQEVVMRLDVGISTEGVRVWLKFNNVFHRLFHGRY